MNPHLNPLSLCFLRTFAVLALSLPTGTWAGSHAEYVITEVMVPNRTSVSPAKINDQGEILGEARDARDQNRAVAPLKPAPDALLLDNSDLTIDESVNWVLNSWEQRRPFGSPQDT